MRLAEALHAGRDLGQQVNTYQETYRNQIMASESLLFTWHLGLAGGRGAKSMVLLI